MKQVIAFLMEHNSMAFDCQRVEGFTIFYELFGARFILDTIEQAEYYLAAYGGYSFKADHGTYSTIGGKQKLCDALTIYRDHKEGVK